MSVYIKKKYCPHCKSMCAYERKVGGKRYIANYGSPIKQCPTCKQYYIDKDCREIAVQGVEKVDTLPIRYSTIALISVLLLTTLFILADCLVSMDVKRGFLSFFLFGGMIAGLIFSDYSGHEKRKKELEQEKQASEERLKNPLYAVTLKKLGYHVPECYLPADIIKDKE